MPNIGKPASFISSLLLNYECDKMTGIVFRKLFRKKTAPKDSPESCPYFVERPEMPSSGGNYSPVGPAFSVNNDQKRGVYHD
jgi:hypothetical protein